MLYYALEIPRGQSAVQDSVDVTRRGRYGEEGGVYRG